MGIKGSMGMRDLYHARNDHGQSARNNKNQISPDGEKMQQLMQKARHRSPARFNTLPEVTGARARENGHGEHCCQSTEHRPGPGSLSLTEEREPDWRHQQERTGDPFAGFQSSSVAPGQKERHHTE